MADKPIVNDTRPEGHSSFSQLPKLGPEDFDALQAFYHFELDTSMGADRAKPGERYWAISEIEVKAGPAILQPQVRKQDNSLWVGDGLNFLVFLSWPDAPQPSAKPDPAYSLKYVAGWTEGKGDVGFGIGPESFLTEAGGPYMIWMSSDPADWADRRVGSDCLKKIGWFDNHIVPNPIFRETVKPGGTVPPVSGNYKLVNVGPDGTILGYIPFTDGAPPSGVSIARLALWQGDKEIGYLNWWIIPQSEGGVA